MSSERIQWEYRTMRVNTEPTQKEATDPAPQLESLGSDGWELTETIDYVGGGTKYLVFRRPAESMTPL